MFTFEKTSGDKLIIKNTGGYIKNKSRNQRNRKPRHQRRIDKARIIVKSLNTLTK